jgi:hypothetical protein
LAIAWVGQQVQLQASFLAYMDAFWVLTLLALAAVPLASALINAARNTGGSIGISLISNVLWRREQFHQTRLVDQALPSSVQYQDSLHQMTAYFVGQGSPPARIWAATASASFPRMSATTTLAPSAAKSRASASPIPCAPPVTIAAQVATQCLPPSAKHGTASVVPRATTEASAKLRDIAILPKVKRRV